MDATNYIQALNLLGGILLSIIFLFRLIKQKRLDTIPFLIWSVLLVVFYSYVLLNCVQTSCKLESQSALLRIAIIFILLGEQLTGLYYDYH